ncbi:hypothetical protein T190820D02B_10841 [Tenacibaculum sp. 190524A05c]
MPVTHGVAGSSPVQTAKSSQNFESFFLYIKSKNLNIPIKVKIEFTVNFKLDIKYI